MDIEETFDLAIRIEEKMSECYKAMCRLCQDEAISKELVRLSYDERAHADLLITGKNYFKEVPDVFSLKSERIAEMQTGLDGVIRLIEVVLGKKINFEKAINDAAELERLLEQFHLRTIAEVKDASLRRLFEVLSSEDKTHVKRLESIMKSSYSPG